MIDEVDFEATFDRRIKAAERRAIVEAVACMDAKGQPGRSQPYDETACARLERTFGTANGGLSMDPASPDVLWWAMRTVMFAHAQRTTNVRSPRVRNCPRPHKAPVDRVNFKACETCRLRKGPSAFLKNGDGRRLCRKCRRNGR